MTHRLKTMTLAMLTLVAGWQVQAQGLRLQSSPAPVPAARAQTQADFIVAIVNSEPVTNNEVRREIQRVMQQMAAQRREPPDPQLLAPEVLETLINHKAQLQLARDTGLRAEESAIDQAEQTIAMQNQFDVAELRRRIVAEGQSVAEFRSQLGEQILIQRLRERDVESRVRVTDLEVEQFQREQQSNVNLGTLQLNLAQILVAVPESVSAVQLEALQARAQRALERARAGDDFAALVREFSDASDLSSGGQLGLRTADRYPDLFVQATQQLTVGEVAALVRSPAGFHVLKVVEKVNLNQPTMAVTQSHARHILLLPSASLSEADARRKLLDIKKRVVAKQADFATLARETSQDGSAPLGGDLGWTSPGMLVPEFEAVMNRLAPGEVSDPLLSRFGLHLIQLLERRKASLSPEQQREAIRAMLREKKMDEAYSVWAQELRGRAYVEMREPPL